MASNPQGQFQPSPQGQTDLSTKLRRFTFLAAEFVRAAIVVMAYLVGLAAAVAAASLAISAILWFVTLAKQALGLGE